MKIQDLDILRLMPSFMKSDEQAVKNARLMEIALKILRQDVDKCGIYYRISELPEEIIDELAWQFHVDFYDATLPLQKKRDLVEQSMQVHMIKGTPRAVEMVLEAAFDESWVIEWFNYGGPPATFKVRTTDRVTEEQSIIDLTTAINSVKNVRSHLTEFEILRENIAEDRFAGVVHARKIIKIQEG